MRHGWLAIPGVQTGDRTVDEQMLGVREALAECKGKTVEDFGCAEGLLGREFIRAGAARCHGIDAIADHLAVARRECAGLPMTFQLAGLQEWAVDHMLEPEQFDIVLSLGVCHKLHDPGIGIRFSARSAKELCLVRMHARSEQHAGILRSKHRRTVTCNVNEIMAEEGFRLDKILAGPKEETVWWWRK